MQIVGVIYGATFWISNFANLWNKTMELVDAIYLQCIESGRLDFAVVDVKYLFT